jgi:hypothetical protein
VDQWHIAATIVVDCLRISLGLMVFLQAMVILSSCAASLPRPATLLRCVALLRPVASKRQKGTLAGKHTPSGSSDSISNKSAEGQLLLLPLSPSFGVARGTSCFIRCSLTPTTVALLIGSKRGVRSSRVPVPASAISSTLAFWSVLATQRRARGSSCTTFHSVVADGHELADVDRGPGHRCCYMMRGATLVASLAASVPLTAMAQRCGITTAGVKWCFTPDRQQPAADATRLPKVINVPKLPLCGAIAVSPTGLLSCAGTGQSAVGEMHQPTGSELGRTFTVIEQGTGRGYCVSGETLKQVYVIDFESVEGFLRAHAQECSRWNSISNWIDRIME